MAHGRLIDTPRGEDTPDIQWLAAASDVVRAAPLLDLYRRVVRTGVPERREIFSPSDQRWYTVAAHRSVPNEFVVIVDDITQRQRDEHADRWLAAIVASSDDAIIGKTLDGVVTSWNHGAEVVFGYAAADAVGRRLSDLIIPPERAAEEQDIIARLTRGEIVRHFETTRIRRDGARIVVSVAISPVRDADGRVVGASKVARDVSSRKRAEEELQRHAARLSALAQASKTLAAAAHEVPAVAAAMVGALSASLNGVCVAWLASADGRTLTPAARDAERGPDSAGVAQAFDCDLPADGATPWAVAYRERHSCLAPRVEAGWLRESVPPSARAAVEALGVHTVMWMPISAPGETLGTVAVVRHLADQPAFTHDDQALAVELTERAALALSNARQSEQRRLSEERFAKAFHSNPAALAISRVDNGRYIDVNPAFEAVTGYAADELRGHSAVELGMTAPGRREHVIGQMKAQGSLHGVKSTIRRKSGEVREAMLSLEPILLDDVPCVLGFVVDVTDQRRAEERLRAQEELFTDMGRIAHIGGWSFDPATGEGTWTDEVARIHELDPAEATSKDIGLTFYQGESRERVERALAQALQQGTPYDLELELTTRAGTRKWVRTIAHPVVEAGRVVRLRGSFQDITERKRTDHRLATQNAVSRVLASSASLDDAMTQILEAVALSEGWDVGTYWRLDEPGAMLRCGDTWSRAGVDVSALMALTRQLSFAKGQGMVGEVWAQAAADLRYLPDFANTPRYPRADAALAAGLRGAVAFPIMVGDEVTGVIDFLARDIEPPDERLRDVFATVGRQVGLFMRQRQAEAAVRALNAVLELRVAERTSQLEQANHELEAFSYSVSHDLRAPLRAVDGFSQALVEDFGDVLPADGREFVQIIRNETRRMGQLIDDLLTFSRLSRLPLKQHDIDTNVLVAEALDELRAQRVGRVVEIVVDELPPCRGDSALLKQVWLNLLGNALKYTKRRERAEIRVTGRHDGPATAFSVSDNGAGFDMRYAHKLFGVFQRLHRADEFEGTGVGLAIVQRIVLRHGGRVSAEGAVDAGATISFTLPRHDTTP